MLPTASDDRVRVQLLGGFSVSISGVIVPAAAFRLRAAALLIKLLALSSGYRLHREQAMDALWPDADPDAASRNLRYALHIARKTLASTGQPVDGFLERQGESLALAPPERVTVDVIELEAATERAWRSGAAADFHDAIDLYRGELLPEDRYEDWIEERRAALRRSHLILLGRLAQMHESERNLTAAIQTLQRVLAIDPADEPTHAHLMRLYADSGQRSSALRQYELLTSVLDEELAAEPDAATRDLAEAIRTGDHRPSPVPEAPRAVPQPPDQSSLPRLPAPLTSLLGRERELAELEQILSTHRLVTLTGTGGVGKTRLALEVARAVAAGFPDGVAFIELAPLRDPALVLPAIHASLGLTGFSSEPVLDQLVAYLQDRSLLLALDNLEHLPSCVSDIATLLTRCPALRVLATSRTRLRLRGEQHYPVAPLPLPPDTVTTPDAVCSAASAQLFVERAREADPAFRLDDETAPLVSAICHRLDGLPLALELAAAHVDVAPLATLLAQLERRLDRLDDGPVDLPERQRALRNAIGWSYDLLDRNDQTLLRSLGVFAGGWSADAALAIAPEGIDVPGGLERLTEHHLVWRAPNSDGAQRFGMLETIREYAFEQMQAAGESETRQRRHAGFVRDMVEPVAPSLQGTEQAAILSLLDAEQQNLRAALTWALDHDPPLALEIIGFGWRYWYARGLVNEGRRWLSLALECDTGEAPHARARALDGAGVLALAQADLVAARAHIEDFQREVRILGDPASVARGHFSRAILASHERNIVEARASFRTALALYRELRDEFWITAALNNLGSLAAMEEDDAEAELLYVESLQRARAVADQRSIEMALRNLGWIYARQGRLDEAAAHYAEALTIADRLNDRWMRSTLLNGAGFIALQRGELPEAHRLLAESLSISYELGDEDMMSGNLRWLASVAVRQDEPLRAARLFGAAEAVRAAPATTADRLGATYHERYVEQGRAQTPATDWEAAWTAGRQAPLGELIRDVLDQPRRLE